MSKQIVIKLTKAGRKTGPFTITDNNGTVIGEHIEKASLIAGLSYVVDDNVVAIMITSEQGCMLSKYKNIGESIDSSTLANTEFQEATQACLWQHLTKTDLFNSFYGNIEKYILEIPYSYQFRDEILHSIKSYDKIYRYFPDASGVFNNYEKITLDNEYFNKLIVYNDQQNSGLLELVAKPKNNLRAYNLYPLYGTESKTIIYTKSDGFYNINTFWDVVKDRSTQQFITNCSSLSEDKQLNQNNMDYSKRTYTKAQLRAKDIKCRFILDDKSDIHIVSKFTLAENQISYK